MSVVDKDRFLQCITRSGVLKKESLDKWLAEINADASVKDLARDLIRKKLTTKWQGKMLAKGASRLKLGNYLLTDRIPNAGNVEFGDQFAALHQQLSRDVVIQYLPAAVCDSKESKKKIFTVGSKLADLDHPNLVHVYDVDEEKNRIYMVSETCDGKSLKDYLAEESPISCKSIGRIVAGCIKGLSYAHSKGVVHGGVSESTVVVKPGGDIQIESLTQFAVQNAISENPKVASDDLAAVESVGKQLLAAVAEEERTSEPFSTLTNAIGMIGKDSITALDVVNDLLESDSQLDQSADEMVLAPEAERAPATSNPATATVASAESAANNMIPAEEVSEGILTRMARRNPVALIGASALSALLLIGGTVFAASQLVATPAQTAAADFSDGSDAKKKSQKKKNAPPTKVDRLDFRNMQGALSNDSGAAVARDELTDPEANKAAINAIFDKTPVKKEKATVEVVQKTPAAGAEETSDVAAPAPSEADVAAAVTPKVAVVQKEMKPKSKADAKEDVLAAGADPFQKFAKVVDLPDVASAEQASFGKLILEKKHLLGAEILSTPQAHRSKPMFVMNRSADDKQSWEISYKKKKKSNPVAIAKLQKTPSELRFNWLPGAAEVPAANFLRNCRVKLSTATHSHWLTLRKPFKIDGFQLSEDKGSVKLDVDIPFMPNPAAIAATLSGIKFKRMDKSDYKQKAHIAPPEITPTVPARMYFHEKSKRFLSLDVLADVRKKFTLRAALVIQPSKDQPGVMLEDPRTIPQVAQQIRNLAQAAQQQSEQAQASKIKKEEKDAYKKAASQATGQAALTAYYEHVVPQLVEKDIPVTISYALNDQHRIVLAYTVETQETKKK